MPPPQRDRPLNDAECARLNAVLSRFGSEYAMNNLEEIDGFFAALICSSDFANPETQQASSLSQGLVNY
jgi:hypothetical protein